MHKLILKTATGVAAIGLMLAVVAPSAFAANIEVKNNGKKSKNAVTVVSTKKNVVKQSSNTVAMTFVNSVANTGNNKANGNTGPGAVAIVTGPATSTVTTTVTGGSNTAMDPNCGCPDEMLDIDVTGNGKKSQNTVTVVSGTTNVTKQSSNTFAVTAVSSVANSGGNTASGNTGDGAVEITTKAANSDVTTEVTGGGNDIL